MTNPTFPNMADQHPGFDQTTLPEIPPQWLDSTWKNDTCPSFMPMGEAKADQPLLQVYIDYADPAEREMGGKRFAITLTDPDGSADCLAEGDDWDEILRGVATFSSAIAQ